MKNLILITLAVVLFAACKKESSPAKTTDDNKTLIIGRWYFTQDTVKQYKNGILVYYSTTGGLDIGTAYEQFNADGTYTDFFNGKASTSPYSLEGNTLTLTQSNGTESGQIKTLSSTKLVIFYDDNFVDGNTTSRTTEVAYLSK